MTSLTPKVKVAFLPVQGQDLEANLQAGEWDLAIAGEQQIGDKLQLTATTKRGGVIQAVGFSGFFA